MINQVEKKNPKRRFKEFLGKENWNVHTLGTVLMSTYNGQTPSRSKGEYWNGKINWLTSGELNCGIVNDTLEKITELGLDSANLKIIPKGILVIAITGLEASGTRGNCAILGCNTTLNQSCMALFPIRSLISSDFLFNWYLFIGDYYGIKYTQGTKQQSYNSKILNDLEIVIPSLDEQNKISSFFSKLDSMIDFQKRKLNKLQATKKALLQEMFPEEGQDKPKRRFKGFTDAWKQRKLGDVIASLYNGQTPSKFDKANWEGDIPWLTSGELNRGVVNHSIEKITQQGRDDANLKIVPKGTVVIAITGLEAAGTRGNCAKLGFDTTLNQSCMAIYPKSEFLDPDFLFQWYIAVGEEYGIKYTQGTKQQSYNAELIKILPISVPRVTEQRKITRILDSFDDIITLHQRKLDKLKNLKQAYLNEMFV